MTLGELSGSPDGVSDCVSLIVVPVHVSSRARAGATYATATTVTMNARYAINNKEDRNTLLLPGNGSGWTGRARAIANSSK